MNICSYCLLFSPPRNDFPLIIYFVIVFSFIFAFSNDVPFPFEKIVIKFKVASNFVFFNSIWRTPVTFPLIHRFFYVFTLSQWWNLVFWMEPSVSNKVFYTFSFLFYIVFHLSVFLLFTIPSVCALRPFSILFLFHSYHCFDFHYINIKNFCIFDNIQKIEVFFIFSNSFVGSSHKIRFIKYKILFREEKNWFIFMFGLN